MISVLCDGLTRFHIQSPENTKAEHHNWIKNLQ